jgi:hypothetical protein
VARRRRPPLPRRFGRESRFLVAHWGVIAVLALPPAPTSKRVVQFYAVAVFANFLAATLGCIRLSRLDRRSVATAGNLVGATLVASVLALIVTRLDPIISLLASSVVALYLRRMWVARGRPGGVATVKH